MPKNKKEEVSLTTLFQNEGVAEKLFTLLPVKDLMSLNQVDKALHAATNREEVWKLHWRKLVGANATEPASFKEACREIIKNLYQEERAKKEQANIGEFLSSLPDETLISILSFLDMAELSKVGRTSKYLKKLSEDDGLWSAFIKKRFNVEPPKNQPMKAYFRHLKSNILKEKFLKEYPEVVLTAPKEERKPKKPLLSFGESYLEWLCFEGNKAELETFLLSYKHASIEEAHDSNDKRVPKLMRCINLALDNKNCPEAFSLLMISLGFETRAKLISLFARNKAYYYVFLNFMKFGFPIQRSLSEPILMQTIEIEERADRLLMQFIKFLVAYNIDFATQDKDGKNLFHLGCEYSSLELVKYFVFEVSQVTQTFFALGRSSWINRILEALVDVCRDQKKFTAWMDIIAYLIQLFPQLLEEKVASNRQKTIAEGIVDACKPEAEFQLDWAPYKSLFLSIDNFLLRHKGLSLLHYILIYTPEHPMLEFWIKERGQCVIENKKYIDLQFVRVKKSDDLHEVNFAPLMLAYLSDRKNLLKNKTSNPLKAFELLLKSGANPNVFLNNEPLLWVLVKNELIKLAKLFLEYGADPTYVDDSGKNPIWKISKKYPELHELVKKNYKKLGKALPLSKAEQALENKLLWQQIEKLMADAAKPVRREMIEKSTQTAEEDFLPLSPHI